MNKPLFIVFEGIDGAGKTTQAALLASYLQSLGVKVLSTREPSDGPIGRQLRTAMTRPDPEEEARLFTEDRRLHVNQVIIPALAAGRTVICDRYVYSSVAYQGARGVDISSILADNYSFALQADVTFLLEIPTDVALTRIVSGRSSNLSPFEVREQLDLVAEIYRRIDHPSIRRIDASVLPEEVSKRIRSVLREMTGCTRL